MTLKYFTPILSVFAFGIAISVTAGGSSAMDKQFQLERYGLSPDGKLVAFEYRKVDGKSYGIGLFDRQTGKINRISPPNGFNSIGRPQFSPDGKMLAAIAGGQVAVIDLSTLQARPVTSGPTLKVQAIFQPHANKIFVEHYIIKPDVQLSLLDLDTGKETPVLASVHGFSLGTAGLTFIGPDRLMFTAVSGTAVDPAMKAAEVEFAGGETRFVPYRLRIGERPELATSLKPTFDRSIRLGGLGVTSFSASRDGARIVFVSFSGGEMPTPQGKGRQFKYDLFKLESAEPIQVTHLGSHLAYPTISYDGKTAAFGDDPKRQYRFDLSIVDLDSGRVTTTNLLAHIVSDPAFASDR